MSKDKKMKTWFVAVDIPGQGWNMYLEAPSKKVAIERAIEQMGEAPNVVREVEGTLTEIKLRAENRELKNKLKDILSRVEELKSELWFLTR